MDPNEPEATIYYDSAALSAPGNVSADVSRADVAFVVGSRPKFVDETAQLLRTRLGAATYRNDSRLSAR